VASLKQLIDNWILLAQGLIGSVGALAFAIDPFSCTSETR